MQLDGARSVPQEQRDQGSIAHGERRGPGGRGDERLRFRKLEGPRRRAAGVPAIARRTNVRGRVRGERPRPDTASSSRRRAESFVPIVVA